MELLSGQFIAMRRQNDGPRFDAWLAQLPQLVARLCERWELELVERLQGGSYGCVWRASRAGQPLVLKIQQPYRPLETQALALRALEPGAAPAVLDYAPAEHALLLEWLDAGPWVEGELELDIAAGASMLGALGRARELSALPPLAELARERFDHALELLATRSRTSRAALLEARAAALTLAADQVPEALIHGDFQPKNALRRPDGSAVLIDPMGARGDACWDAAMWALLCSPGTGTLERAAALASRCELPLDRIVAWMRALLVAELQLGPERLMPALERSATVLAVSA